MQIVLLGAARREPRSCPEVGTASSCCWLTIFNAAMGINQEGKAAASVAALQKMMIVKAASGETAQLVEVAAGQLVPGDIVGWRRATASRPTAGSSGPRPSRSTSRH